MMTLDNLNTERIFCELAKCDFIIPQHFFGEIRTCYIDGITIIFEEHFEAPHFGQKAKFVLLVSDSERTFYTTYDDSAATLLRNIWFNKEQK
jgi:hypothetical protein